MSVIGGEADIAIQGRHVANDPIADIGQHLMLQ